MNTLADGTVIRPEVVVFDDPQTRDSAESKLQTQARLAIIEGDVLGMAGPGQSISRFARVRSLPRTTWRTSY